MPLASDLWCVANVILFMLTISHDRHLLEFILAGGARPGPPPQLDLPIVVLDAGGGGVDWIQGGWFHGSSPDGACADALLGSLN